MGRSKGSLPACAMATCVNSTMAASFGKSMIHQAERRSASTKKASGLNRSAM
jgi:hypothetical protein